MSTNPEPPAAPGPRLNARQTRDVMGALLIVTGVVGLLVVLFVLDPLVGYAALSLLAIAVGVYLGLER